MGRAPHIVDHLAKTRSNLDGVGADVAAKEMSLPSIQCQRPSPFSAEFGRDGTAFCSRVLPIRDRRALRRFGC